MNTQILIKEANSLPVEERAIIVDSLLKTLNTPESDIDQKWVTVAKARLQQIHSGEVKTIPSEEVFSKIWSRFSK